MSAVLPKSAKVVVIGGGVAGCSVAYHLAKYGWKDTILLERDQLTSGTTWHAAGLVSQLGPTAAVTSMVLKSVSLKELLIGFETSLKYKFKIGDYTQNIYLGYNVIDDNHIKNCNKTKHN